MTYINIVQMVMSSEFPFSSSCYCRAANHIAGNSNLEVLG